MGLGDVAGIFSRYFVVGFFLPAFALLVIAAITVSSCLLPNAFERQSPAAEIAILGGTGLFLGLLLQGLSHPILRLYEGYGLKHALEWLGSPKRSPRWRRAKRLVGAVYGYLLTRQTRRWEELRRARRLSPSEEAKAVAAWRFDLQYPRKRAYLLPSGFGNSIRAFETNASHRWGLDGIAAGPRVSAFMSDKEHEIHADAKADVMFFLNLSLLSLALVLVWLVDLVAAPSISWYLLPASAIVLAASYGAYRGAVGAAQRWGSVVRSEIDLHRLEVYEKMGVRAPSSFSEERETLGPAVSRCILHGNRLPDELRAPKAEDNGEEDDE